MFDTPTRCLAGGLALLTLVGLVEDNLIFARVLPDDHKAHVSASVTFPSTARSDARWIMGEPLTVIASTAPHR